LIATGTGKWWRRTVSPAANPSEGQIQQLSRVAERHYAPVIACPFHPQSDVPRSGASLFPVITPMPFTPLWAEMKDRIRVWDYSKYNLVTPIVEPYEMTMDEITIALGRCYMTFYAGKMKEILSLPEGFKRRYMLSAMKNMMKDYGELFDFLGLGMAKMSQVMGLGVPKEMKEAMKDVGGLE
jgi:hypothetical protein